MGVIRYLAWRTSSSTRQPLAWSLGLRAAVRWSPWRGQTPCGPGRVGRTASLPCAPSWPASVRMPSSDHLRSSAERTGAEPRSGGPTGPGRARGRARTPGGSLPTTEGVGSLTQRFWGRSSLYKGRRPGAGSPGGSAERGPRLMAVLMAGRARGDKKTVAGGIGTGLVVALCCGGLPLFASVGLGATFAGLQLWPPRARTRCRRHGGRRGSPPRWKSPCRPAGRAAWAGRSPRSTTSRRSPKSASRTSPW